MSAFDIYREIIRENIEYDIMTERYPYDKDRINEIVDLMLETVCTARKTIRVAGDDYPAELIKAKFLKLHSRHLEFVLDCLNKELDGHTQYQEISACRPVQRAVHNGQLLHRACGARHG